MGSHRFLTAALVVVAAAALGGLAAGRAPAAAPAGLDRLVGVRLVVGIDGTTATPSLLERIRAGRVGGVILMGRNVRSAPQVRALTASLRAAAQAGGRRLLIMTDQEGGPHGASGGRRRPRPRTSSAAWPRARFAGAAARPRRRSSGSASTSTSRRSPTSRPPRARSSRGSDAGSRRSRRASPRT